MSQNERVFLVTEESDLDDKVNSFDDEQRTFQEAVDQANEQREESVQGEGEVRQMSDLESSLREVVARNE